MDNLSYRVGFEDACDVLLSMVKRNPKSPRPLVDEITTFMAEARASKAEQILANMDFYSKAARVVFPPAGGIKP